MIHAWDTEEYAFLFPKIPGSLLEDALRRAEVRSTHHQFFLIMHVRLLEELRFFVK